MRGVDACLRNPTDLQRNQSPKEFLRIIHIGRNVVVDEEKEILSCPDAGNLSQDSIDRPSHLGRVEVGLNRAELTAKVAAAACLYELDRDITLACVYGAVILRARERGPHRNTTHRIPGYNTTSYGG